MGKTYPDGLLVSFWLVDPYYYGRYVPQDQKMAAQWLTKAAERGAAPAQNTLGLMYHSGKGVIEDHVEAYKWYVLAAMQGGEFGQFARELKEYFDQTMTLDQIKEGQCRVREFLAMIEKRLKDDRRNADTATK